MNQEFLARVEHSMSEEVNLARSGFGIIDEQTCRMVSAIIQRSINERAELIQIIKTAPDQILRLNEIITELEARVRFLEGADAATPESLSAVLDPILNKHLIESAPQDLLDMAEKLLERCIILIRDPSMHGLVREE